MAAIDLGWQGFRPVGFLLGSLAFAADLETTELMDNIVTLGLLILLQAVLGFDNLLYISLESKRAPASERKRVRTLGIGIAIVLRIVLLVVVLNLIEKFQSQLFGFEWPFGEAHFNGHSLIVLGGGIFILYTAVKEIFHMLSLEEAHAEELQPTSTRKVVTWIVLMNLVFSFDSILSAMALTKVIWVMATAIVISGLLMIWLADHVSTFLEKNRAYEVLGLFVLFIVGIMLISEGGHLAHIVILEHEVHAMGKGTFYFVITILVLTDIVQSRYQGKLVRKRLAQKALADGTT